MAPLHGKRYSTASRIGSGKRVFLGEARHAYVLHQSFGKLEDYSDCCRYVSICGCCSRERTGRKGSPPPPCTSAYCKKVKSFLKKHYCGESPAGNGPDDGCDLRNQRTRERASASRPNPSANGIQARAWPSVNSTVSHRKMFAAF